MVDLTILSPTDAQAARETLLMLYKSNRETYEAIFQLERSAPLSSEMAGPLLNSGLIKPENGGSFSSDFAISETNGAFIITDKFTATRYDRIYPLYLDESILMARNLSASAGEEVLDMCMGSGVYAVVAALKGARVTAVDVNARALNFASFNASLNSVTDNIMFVHSDLFSTVPEKKYDLVVMNPPFIAVPKPDAWFLHGTAEWDGLSVLKAFLNKAPLYLKENGRIQVITNSFVREDGQIEVVNLFQRAFGGQAEISLTQAFTPDVIPAIKYARKFWGSPGYEEWVKKLEESDLTGICRIIVNAAASPNSKTNLTIIPAEKYVYDISHIYGHHPSALPEPLPSGGWSEMLSRYSALNRDASFSSSEPFLLPVETKIGRMDFESTVFQKGTETYFVLEKAMQSGGRIPFVRIHSACNFGNIFHSAKCNCGPQLENTLVKIGTEGGVLIYALHQDGRCISPVEHANSYMLQGKGFDTVESYNALGLRVDSRDYSTAAKILRYCYGLKEVRLITNNPKKAEALEREGVTVKTVNALVAPDQLNEWRVRQFKAAKEKLGQKIPKALLRLPS